MNTNKVNEALADYITDLQNRLADSEKYRMIWWKEKDEWQKKYEAAQAQLAELRRNLCQPVDEFRPVGREGSE